MYGKKSLALCWRTSRETASKALVKLGQFSLALEQIEKSLTIDPED
ncbi:MAG: hypothetical protein WA364_05755 [Candidatus Nitrosopolaris sp.]